MTTAEVRGVDETTPAVIAHITDVGHVARRELAGRGRAERKRVPRRAHADWSPPANRPDPLEILRESNVSRAPELVPVRYGRMLVNSFAFFRGAPAVMASDLALTPRTAIWPQICGDAHLSNFGFFGTPERALVFDLNDFDETLPGPFEWDLKRLTTSCVVAARAYGLGEDQGRRAAQGAVVRYAASMNELASATTLDIWYSKVASEDVMRAADGARLRRRLRRSFDKAEGRDHFEAYSKLAAVIDGRHVIVDDPPLIMHTATIQDESLVRNFLEEYKATLSYDRRHLLEQYELADVAMKVVGVGSVGTYCYVALFVGRGEDDVLMLQVKQAKPSVLEPFLGRSELSQPGERVVVGQRIMQAASDLFLGWATSDSGRAFFVRQLRDMKMSLDFATMPDDGFLQYAALCGHTLARAHANSCDPTLIAGYVGKGAVLSAALTQFAQAYADQTDEDYARLAAAARDGVVEVVEETS